MAHDEIIAVRKVMSTSVPDLIVGKVNITSCKVDAHPWYTKTVGSPGHSEWLDVAVGDFDGVAGKEIALLRTGLSPFVFLRYDPTLQILVTTNLPGANKAHPWKTIAAANIDTDSRTELIAARCTAGEQRQQRNRARVRLDELDDHPRFRQLSPNLVVRDRQLRLGQCDGS